MSAARLTHCSLVIAPSTFHTLYKRAVRAKGRPSCRPHTQLCGMAPTFTLLTCDESSLIAASTSPWLLSSACALASSPLTTPEQGRELARRLSLLLPERPQLQPVLLALCRRFGLLQGLRLELPDAQLLPSLRAAHQLLAAGRWRTSDLPPPASHLAPPTCHLQTPASHLPPRTSHLPPRTSHLPASRCALPPSSWGSCSHCSRTRRRRCAARRRSSSAAACAPLTPRAPPS